MKRSEIIKKMVHDTFHILSGERMDTAHFPYKVAELMLEVCEKEGMLPPYYITRLENGLEVRYLAWELE